MDSLLRLAMHAPQRRPARPPGGRRESDDRPSELSAPGSAHEAVGHALLLARGVPERLARFARSHASWGEPGVTVEELLVSLADKAWKNKRVPDLEDRVVDRLAAAGGRERWEAFLALDDLLTRIGEDAPRRLAVQAEHPVRVEHPVGPSTPSGPSNPVRTGRN